MTNSLRTMKAPRPRTTSRRSSLSGTVVRSTNLQFFLARADLARTEVEAATLDHVRERCRRAEAAWNALPAQAQRTERLRTEEVERKAAQALE